MNAIHQLVLTSVMPQLDLEAKRIAREAEIGVHTKRRASIAARLAGLRRRQG